MAKLKVYGANLDGRYRGIVAATSQTKAAEALGISPYDFRSHGCETANREEVELAMREPGKAWKQGYGLDRSWHPMN